MTSDVRVLHFRIPDHVPTAEAEHTHTLSSAPPPTSTVAKPGAHEWMCQLSILEDKAMVRGTLGPLTLSETNRVEFQSCCSLEITTVRESVDNRGDAVEVLLCEKVKSEDLFKRGIEYREDIWVDHNYEFQIILSCHPIKLLGSPDNANWTHTLALSECDPVARNIDPLVEMMTQFERHAPTSDVECRFIDKAGLVLDRMRAHHAVLSIFPAFSQKLAQTQAQRNPYQRTTPTILTVPVETWPAFERMLGFIYSGRLPRDGFAPRSDQWRITFLLNQEYGLDKCTSSSSWMEWHLTELEQVITDENVLEIYFGWGFEYVAVAEMCVRHVADRSQVQHVQGRDLGAHVMGLLREKYQGRKGCHEFQEALVALLMKMYAEQQQQQQQVQQRQQQRAK
ncbi:hypothetical protein BGZ58_005128 [Dissophora ornata]|nr:hypothetical protein BGZ58_005128 [Dissophora ornata]